MFFFACNFYLLWCDELLSRVDSWPGIVSDNGVVIAEEELWPRSSRSSPRPGEPEDRGWLARFLRNRVESMAYESSSIRSGARLPIRDALPMGCKVDGKGASERLATIG